MERDLTRMNDDDLKRLHGQLEVEITSTELALQTLLRVNQGNRRKLDLVKRLLGWPLDSPPSSPGAPAQMFARHLQP